MPDLEFTGERVIPGLVETNLFNEHFARYRFAARFVERYAAGGRVLDAGCGSGYGSAQLAKVGQVAAIDVSAEAVAYAREHFSHANTSYAQAGCEALPFADATFNVITAFEVIEHLDNWKALLTEARRVLLPTGCLLVSTPNEEFYAETRADAGPNPFHRHEFDYAGFAAALGEVFPHVSIWRQNHSEGIVFAKDESRSGDLEIASAGQTSAAHFYLAVCSAQPLSGPPEGCAPAFAWMPESANVLQTRALHIKLLNAEVVQKTEWLNKLQTEHAELLKEHQAALREMGLKQQWVDELKEELKLRDESVLVWKGSAERLESEAKILHDEFQQRLAARDQEAADSAKQWSAEYERLAAEILSLHGGYQGQVAAMERNAAETAASWATENHRIHEEFQKTASAYQEAVARLESELSAVHHGYSAKIASLEQEFTVYRAEVAQMQTALESATVQLRGVEASRWNRLGRSFGVGPKVNAG